MSVAEELQLIMEKTPEAFISEKAAGLNAAIQLNLTGEDGGQWYLLIADGQMTVHEGQANSPNLTLTLTAADYVALSLGQAGPMALFMSGKIRVQGDVKLAMQFPDMFDRDRVEF